MAQGSSSGRGVHWAGLDRSPPFTHTLSPASLADAWAPSSRG